MTIFVQRSGWGAKPPTCTTPFPGPLLGLAVHYTASHPDEQLDHRNCAARVRLVQQEHMSPASNDPTKPWCDIAYSFLVCRHGYVFTGRGWGKRPASQGLGRPGGNDHYYSVCFLGNDNVGYKDVTDAAYTAILAVRNQVAGKGGHEVHPHSYWYATACPGDELRYWIANGAKDPTKPPAPLPLRHFSVSYADAQGQQHTDWHYVTELETFARNVAAHHAKDAKPYPVILTFDPAGHV